MKAIGNKSYNDLWSVYRKGDETRFKTWSSVYQSNHRSVGRELQVLVEFKGDQEADNPSGNYDDESLMFSPFL